MRVTSGRSDPELANILVSNSKDTVFWMHGKGVPMEPALGVAGVKRGNVWYWPPGMVVRAAHEGVGLSNSWFNIAETRGRGGPLLHRGDRTAGGSAAATSAA